MVNISALFVIKQWTGVYFKVNPTEAESSATGFCRLPISLPDPYYCQVYANYFDNCTADYDRNEISDAVKNKRHANFILDTAPHHIKYLNGFNYGLDFSPTVTGIGFGYYALIVCIKEK